MGGCLAAGRGVGNATRRSRTSLWRDRRFAYKDFRGFLEYSRSDRRGRSGGRLHGDSLSYEGILVSERLAPLGDAAMEIKLMATTAHLIFEEIEGEDVQVVWNLLDKTLFYVDAILNGGENDEDTFYAS